MSRFSIMTWNVENLFQYGTQYGPKTLEAYDKKLNNLVKIIQQLDPDVIALQEIGDQQSFDDLAQTSGYSHMVLGVPDGRGIRVGYLSKLPFLGEPQNLTVFPSAGLESVQGEGIDEHGKPKQVTKMSRGVLLVQVEPVPNFAVTLMNVHFKSKLLTYPNPGKPPRFSPRNEHERSLAAGLALLKRTAEAVAVRVKANEVLENNDHNPLIVLGDLNDVTEAATTQILKGPSGSEIDSSPRAFNTPDKGDDSRLFNLAPLIHESRRYSRVYKGKRELIDHIFASVEFFPGNPRRIPIVDSHVDPPIASIEDNPNARRDKPASDHAPLTAVFEINNISPTMS